MDEKEKIIAFAQKKFMQEGFYKITMDELASELRMSKKTIYKYFSSKDDLVVQVAYSFREKVAAQLAEIIADPNDNAIIKIVKVMEFMGQLTIKIKQNFLTDMQKHLPELWKDIDEFRTKLMFKNLSRVMEQGKQEGLIRDIPVDIIMTTHVSAIRGVVNPDFLIHNEYSFKEALYYVFDIVLNGILTSKGKGLLKKSKSRLQND